MIAKRFSEGVSIEEGTVVCPLSSVEHHRTMGQILPPFYPFTSLRMAAILYWFFCLFVSCFFFFSVLDMEFRACVCACGHHWVKPLFLRMQLALYISRCDNGYWLKNIQTGGLKRWLSNYKQVLLLQRSSQRPRWVAHKCLYPMLQEDPVSLVFVGIFIYMDKCIHIIFKN